MAGPVAIAAYARRLLIDREGFRNQHRHAVLVWEAPPAAKEDPLLLGTRSQSEQSRPTAGSPVVFEVVKNATNAMPSAVTVGRTPNNDLVIEDNSVSRFHCYVVPGPGRVLSIVDADSSQGTWLNGLKLAPKVPAALHDRDVLKVAEVTLTFYEPPSFVDYLDRLASSG
jgi:hypothetical protein